MGILSVIWSFRTPIACIIGIASILLAIWGYGHHKYNEGFEVGHLEAEHYKQVLAAERADWENEVLKWKKQVKDQEQALLIAKKEKEEIQKRNLDDLFKKQKINDQQRSKRESEITANIKPTDTITVPSVFYFVYNDATKGTDVTSGEQRKRTSSPRSTEPYWRNQYL